MRQTAPEARAFQLQVIHQNVNQRRVRIGIDDMLPTIDFDLEIFRHEARPPLQPASWGVSRISFLPVLCRFEKRLAIFGKQVKINSVLLLRSMRSQNGRM